MNDQSANETVSRRKIRWLTREQTTARITRLWKQITEFEEADLVIRCDKGHKVKVRGMLTQTGFWTDKVLIVGKCPRCKKWHGIEYRVYRSEKTDNEN